MILLESNIFAKGAFSDVFADSKTVKAYKLFISYHHPRADVYDYSETEFATYRSKVYQSEVLAYDIINSNNRLKVFVPKYFGIQRINRVIGTNGIDVSKNYLLDCCFVMELLIGESTKIGSIDASIFKVNQSVYLVDILEEMQSKGIGFVEDCSIIQTLDGVKIIDFATVDFSEFEKFE